MLKGNYEINQKEMKAINKETEKLKEKHLLESIRLIQLLLIRIYLSKLYIDIKKIIKL